MIIKNLFYIPFQTTAKISVIVELVAGDIVYVEQWKGKLPGNNPAMNYFWGFMLQQ